jgi:tetratricopeptide (TPR) repeat protein
LGFFTRKKAIIDQAKTYYRKALDHDPEFAPAANNLAWILVETGGSLDEALGLAQTAKRLYPDDPAISDTLGWIYVHREAYVSAIAQFQDALRGAPGHPTIRYHMAVAQHGIGNNSEAMAHLKMALESEQDFPEREQARELLEKLVNMAQ